MKILITLLLAIITTTTLATEQRPDTLLYEGKNYSLHTNPMELYFDKYPSKKPRAEVISTGLWRGYVATFEFKSNTLILKDIHILQSMKSTEKGNRWKSVKDGLVSKDEDLAIDWFTGILEIPYGKKLDYLLFGYESPHSNYILLEVKNGKITDKRDYSYLQYEAFKDRQFSAYKKTDAYQKQITDMQTVNLPEGALNSLIQKSIVKYTAEFLDEGQ